MHNLMTSLMTLTIKIQSQIFKLWKISLSTFTFKYRKTDNKRYERTVIKSGTYTMYMEKKRVIKPETYTCRA